MLKKGLLKVMTLALVLGVLTLNSCKDHESRFENVEGRLAKIEKADYTKQTADLKTALNAAIKLAENDVKALDAKIKELKANNKVELDKATQNLEALIAKGATKVELEAAIKNLVAKSATKAELEDAIKKLTANNAANKTELETAIKELANNSVTKAELENAKKELTANGNTIKTQLEVAIKALTDKSATKVELENAKKELTSKLVSLEAFNLYKKEMEKSLDGVKKSVGEINSLLSSVQGDLKNKATKEALETLKTLLQGKITGIKTEIQGQKTALETLLNDYKKVNDKVVAKNTERLGEVEKGIEDIKTQISGIRVELKDYALATDLSKATTRLSTIEAILNITNGKSTIFTDLTTNIADIKAELLKNIKKNSTDISNLDQAIKKLQGELTTLQGEYKAQKNLINGLTTLTATHTAAIENLWKAVNKKADKEAIDKLNDLLGTTNGVTNLIKMVEDNKVLSDELKSTIERNKKAYETANKDLKKEIDALASSNTKNKSDIVEAFVAIANFEEDFARFKNQISTAAAATTAALKKMDQRFNVVAEALSLNFESLSRRLTGLTFVPDYYVNSIPTIRVTTLRTGCLDITPTVTIAYKLSPSYISKEDIDWKNIGFATTKSTNMSKVVSSSAQTTAANYAVATFNKIENGTLYVDVTFNREWVASQTDLSYQKDGKETFPTVALQVPYSEEIIKENKLGLDKEGNTTIVKGKSYPKAAVVTASQYTRVDVDDYRRKDLSLVRKDNKRVLVPTLSDAKNLSVKGIDGATTTDPTVFTLAFGKDKSLDLKDKVVALLNSMEIGSEYGYIYEFDLLDENGTKIKYERGTNKTNQQEFINLKNGVVTARVFDDSGISASQGRTPIVRVLAYSKGGKQCALKGFIKIKLEDKPAPKPVVIPLKKLGTKTIVCGQDLNELVFGVKDMNVQVYNKIAFASKTDFHKAYQWVADANNDGTLHVAPDAQATDTYVTKWTISETLIKNKLLTSKEFTFRAKGKYKSSYPSTYPDIEFSYEVTYKRPATKTYAIQTPELIGKYWFGNNSYIKHNVAVPQTGETDPNKAVFETNLSQVFEQTPGKRIKSIANENYRYEFVAYGANKTQSESADGTYLWVKNNGKEVWSKGEKVAEILPYDASKGHILRLNKNSDEAKRLLNADRENLRVSIKIVTDDMLCGNDIGDITVKVAGRDYFNVNFIRPLESEAQSTEYFVDGLNFGEAHTFLDIAKLLNLYDWRYSAEEGGYNSSFVKYNWYYDYYGVSGIEVIEQDIKTNINNTWKKVTDYPNLEVKSVPSPFAVNGNTIATSKYGFVTYRNNSNVLGSKFQLKIPVKITYTWGIIKSFEVTVDVEKTVRQ